MLPHLVEMLGDERIDRDLRYDIADAIKELGDEKVVPRLAKMLDRKGINRDVRSRIAEVIEWLIDKAW